ncbi:MAG: hypothetical protein ACQET1_01500 [Gemmatimonadota bacterium]
MRRVFLPVPSEEELRSRQAHELLRDYPELLPPLLARGVDVGGGGVLTLGELLPGGGPWVAELMGRLAWRDLEGR